MSKPRRNTNPPAPRASKSPPSLSPKAVDAEVVVVRGVEEHFRRHIDAARARAGEAPPAFRGDAALAYHNVRLGLAEVTAARAALEATGYRVDWAALEQLPEIALALAYAAEQVAGQEGVNAEYQRTYARARIVRDIGMSSVEALVKSGDLTAADRKKLLKGGSPLQLAGELDGLARFYAARSDAFRGKSPFTAALAREAAALGEALMRVVTPKGGRKSPSAARAAAARDRDALAALLVARYAELDRAAGALWGRALGDHVPALQARVATARGKKSAVDAPKEPKSAKRKKGAEVKKETPAPAGGGGTPAAPSGPTG
ncbi:MAG: hypothetical protein U0324_24885 [Polyangiales bacterium]